MKTLLVQVRPDPATREHELECFLAKAGVDPDSVTCLNSLEHLPVAEDLDGFDVLVVGGSGDYLVSEGDIPEVIEAVSSLLRAARARQMPILAICFGQQVMAPAFGGKVEKDVERQELGTFEIKKNEAAGKCPLLQSLPQQFDVQLGHKDHVTVLPEGAVNLASSERSPVQVFTFPGEPIYGLTFHPELDKDDILWRLNYYAANYGLTQEAIDEVIERTHDTEIASGLIGAFYSEIVEKGKRYGVEQ